MWHFTHQYITVILCVMLAVVCCSSNCNMHSAANRCWCCCFGFMLLLYWDTYWKWKSHNKTLILYLKGLISHQLNSAVTRRYGAGLITALIGVSVWSALTTIKCLAEPLIWPNVSHIHQSELFSKYQFYTCPCRDIYSQVRNYSYPWQFWLKVTLIQPASFLLIGNDTDSSQKIIRQCTRGIIVEKIFLSFYLHLWSNLSQNLPGVWIISGLTIHNFIFQSSRLIELFKSYVRNI